ncbi:MAG: hypothetical protein WA154_12980 [Moraxellaceae bacterium]
MGYILGLAFSTIFMVLKLTGHITWSWWAVWSPLWGVALLVFVLWAFGSLVERFCYTEEERNRLKLQAHLKTMADRLDRRR